MTSKKGKRYGMLGLGFQRYSEASAPTHEQGNTIQWFLVRLPEPLLKEVVDEKMQEGDEEIAKEKVDLDDLEGYRTGWLNRVGGHGTVITKIVGSIDPVTDMIYCGRGFPAYKRMYSAAMLARMRLRTLGLPFAPQKDGFPTFIFAEENDKFYEDMIPLLHLFYALPGSEGVENS